MTRVVDPGGIDQESCLTSENNRIRIQIRIFSCPGSGSRFGESQTGSEIPIFIYLISYLIKSIFSSIRLHSKKQQRCFYNSLCPSVGPSRIIVSVWLSACLSLCLFVSLSMCLLSKVCLFFCLSFCRCFMNSFSLLYCMSKK